MDNNQYSELLIQHSQDPLYMQIFIILRDKITLGDWQPTDKLPSEPELMAQFQVSRTTLRLALDMLVDRGLIYRQRGRGTFVTGPKVTQTQDNSTQAEHIANTVPQFTLGVSHATSPVTTRILSAGLTPASHHTAKQLEVSSGDELVNMQRIHLAEQQVIAVEVACYVHRYCPGIIAHDLSSDTLETTALDDMLAESYGLQFGRVKQLIQAVGASPTLAARLNVPTGAPLLYVERIKYLHDPAVPFELQKIHYRGDRYALLND